MKTESQWQWLWEHYCKKYEKEHPQTRDFLAARELLLQYTGHASAYHVFEWPYYVPSIMRFLNGSWNKHYGGAVTEVLKKFLHHKETLVSLITTTNDYDHIPFEKDTAESQKNQGFYIRKWVTIGDNCSPDLEEADLKLITEAMNSKNIVNNILTLSDKRQLLLNSESKCSFIKNNKWRIQVQGIFKRKQAYEFLNELQAQLVNHSINPHGDLAKIIRVISKNSGYPITVANDDFFSIKHYGSMIKDLIDTFKPYKSEYYFLRDITQPVEGIKNLIKGISSCVSIPFVFLRNLLKLVFISRAHNDTWFSLGEDIVHNFALLITEPLGYFIDGSFTLVRALTQIVATPLLLFKIPLRLFIGEGIREEVIIDKIKNSKTIQKMFHDLAQISEENEIKTVKTQIVSEIHRKYEKGKHRGLVANNIQEHSLFTKAQYQLQQNLTEQSIFDGNSLAQDEYLNEFRATKKI